MRSGCFTLCIEEVQQIIGRVAILFIAVAVETLIKHELLIQTYFQGAFYTAIPNSGYR